jgi:hypothetical protein
LTFNAIRLTYGLELADLLPPPASTAVVLATDPTAPAAAPTTTGVKIKLSQIIDQGSDQEILMLDNVVLTRYRTRFNDLNGDSLLRKVEVTDAQLSALDFRVTAGQAPFADFGVWGPYGARLECRLKFTHHVMGPDGTWKTMELPGADSLHTWRSCWSVFRTASIMVGVAHPAVLDRYEQLFVDARGIRVAGTSAPGSTSAAAWSGGRKSSADRRAFTRTTRHSPGSIPT